MRFEESLVMVVCAFTLVYLLTDFERWSRKSIQKEETSGKPTQPRQLLSSACVSKS